MDVEQYLNPARNIVLELRDGNSLLFSLDEEMEATPEGVASARETFSDERAPVSAWIRGIEEYWRLGNHSSAIAFAEAALECFSKGSLEDRKGQIPVLCMLATYHIALARTAPKVVLANARADKLVKPTTTDHPESVDDGRTLPQTKSYYLERARAYLRSAAQLDMRNRLVLDGQACLALARGNPEEASRLYEVILKDEPTNLFALMGRGRAMFSRRQYRPALKAYQTVLAYSPDFLPDPRISIGLCYHMLKDFDTARKCWERSVIVHPNSASISAALLLGIASLNNSRNVTLPGGDDARAAAFTQGITTVQAVFKTSKTNPVVAGALASYFLRMDNFPAAIKLSERMIQYADSKIMTSEGHLFLARALQGQGDMDSNVEYGKSMEYNPEQLLAMLGLVQSLASSASDYAQATDTLERALRRYPECIEALVILASIHTRLAFTHQSSTDSLTERKKAKEVYEQALRLLGTTAKDSQNDSSDVKPSVASASVTAISNDPHIFIELARLWSDDPDLDRSLKSYKEAARVYSVELESPVPAQLSNDIAVLELHQGQAIAAINMLEDALPAVAMAVNEQEGALSIGLDSTFTTLTYNLGVIYEAIGDLDKAKMTYDVLLQRHPEFVDAKARMALMAIKLKNYELAHSLTKEALTSQPGNTELRALYTHFLIETNSIKAAREFTAATLKEYNSNDVHAMCAFAMVTYILARENKDQSKEGQKDRAGKFKGAAQIFDKALDIDPYCAYAAQGLAISIAEGTIGAGATVDDATGQPLSESAQRARNSRDALSILMKVKESLADGSVHVNIGHCHFAREEWEKAIQNYETASQRFYEGKNVPTLLYLARSWYHKANKDHNFADLRQSLITLKAARELQPNDLAIMFNLAIVQQKGAEIVFDLPPSKRTLDDINTALADGEESQALFEQLHQDKTTNTPYSKDLPYQRRRYGQTTIKRGPDIIAAQIEYETMEREKLERARVIRETEKARLAELLAIEVERERMRAKNLADQRQLMREEAEKWSVRKEESEDEDRKESKGKKRKAKREKKEGSAAGSGEDEQEKPRRKKSKAQKVKEAKSKMDVDGSDEDEPVRARATKGKKGGKPGKTFKSAEMIQSDTESGEESEASDAAASLSASPTPVVNATDVKEEEEGAKDESRDDDME